MTVPHIRSTARDFDAGGAPDPVAPTADHDRAPRVRLSERLALPRLDDLEVVGWAQQAVRDATTHRQGVVVYGEKGTGRSDALATAVSLFLAGEAARRRTKPDYRMREVRVFPPMRPRTRDELFRTLYELEMGALPWRVGRGGADVMLGHLLAAWREDRVAAVAFSEADAFGSGALDGCRDVIARSGEPAVAAGALPGASVAAWTDRLGAEPDGAAMLGATGESTAELLGTYVAADAPHAHPAAPYTAPPPKMAQGVGVVLLGLASVYDRLRDSAEWGHRWRRAYAVEGLAPGVLPVVYRRLLPACDRHAVAVGEEAWVAFVCESVAPWVGKSIRRAHAHVEDYIALCEDECTTRPETLEAVEFDAERFVDALAGMAGCEELAALREGA